MKIYKYIINTEIIVIDVYFDEKYIYYIDLPNIEKNIKDKYFKDNFKNLKIIEVFDINEIMNKDIFKLINYLDNGEDCLDDINIKFFGTDFQKDVLNACREIKFGHTKSYKYISEKIGRNKAYQAVGGALNKNPIPIIIPCHRIIGEKGQLTGYAGGLEMKIKLLNLEQ